ncbi:regulatory protein SoxS [Salmonella enterica subsp. enterica]|uniref:Regulatory protein SoxS n=1 Tax=Salmonella enterica I TaxID=59201 RepID=A0A3S5DDT7_SALET|nr:regulatory protein SoxS [Salmonella enterica subsp. enterica]
MSHQQIIQTLIEWIDEHIDQPLNIDVVAKKSGYSKWYLQRMFRTVTHQTLGEYIRQRRLLLAAVELRNDRAPDF